MGKRTGKGPVRGHREHLKGFRNGRTCVGLSIETTLLSQIDDGSVEVELFTGCAAVEARAAVPDDRPIDQYSDQ